MELQLSSKLAHKMTHSNNCDDYDIYGTHGNVNMFHRKPVYYLESNRNRHANVIMAIQLRSPYKL